MVFDWDASKAVTNRRKHGVSFDEATTIFDPQQPLILEDWDHSAAEDRYYAIGFSSLARLLMVCIAYDGTVCRIVSARKATRTEVEIYAKEINKRSPAP